MSVAGGAWCIKWSKWCDHCQRPSSVMRFPPQHKQLPINIGRATVVGQRGWRPICLLTAAAGCRCHLVGGATAPPSAPVEAAALCDRAYFHYWPIREARSEITAGIGCWPAKYRGRSFFDHRFDAPTLPALCWFTLAARSRIHRPNGVFVEKQGGAQCQSGLFFLHFVRKIGFVSNHNLKKSFNKRIKCN